MSGLAGNPLYERWLELERGRQWPRTDHTGLRGETRLPESEAECREWGDESSRISQERHALRVRYAYGIPDDDALDAIARRGPVVEVGAGLGYWAALLRSRCVDVVACDALDHEGYWFPPDCLPFLDDIAVVDGAEFARKYPDRTLLLVWPPYGARMAVDALHAYLRAGGQTVVYVGERYGCTADDVFHRTLDVAMVEVETVAIPTWEYLHDYLAIYEKRPRP